MAETVAIRDTSAAAQTVNQAALFQRLRWRLLCNGSRQMFGHSITRPLTILLCSIVVWAFVFTIAFAGLRFLVEVVRLPADEQIVGLLLGMLFFALGVLLIFSGGLILHASLFAAAETAFLLSKPVRAEEVFAYKFQGAMAFSSWAFVLLGSPVLIAYGLVCHAPWYFYASLPLFFLGFILLPGSIGAVLVLLIVNYVPRRRKEVLAVVLVVLTAVVLWYSYRLLSESRAAASSADPMSESANSLLAGISFARSLWLPSAWVARGLQAAGRGDLAGTGYYLGLVWSNGLFLYLVAGVVAGRLYRRGFNRLTTGGDLRRKHGGAWLDRLLTRLLPFVHPGTRLLIVKDFRTFRRDPQQWGQVLLFTGLLVLYFTNIRRLFVNDIERIYQSTLTGLNLCTIALLLCTYTGRFIFPMLSLEGRKFWILGLLPLQREQLLWGKFGFSMAGGLALAGPLTLLSDLMLDAPLTAVLLHLLTVVVLAAGLSGLSVGMGACLPNFRESDPSKIAVGFGGTVNLLIGLAFLLATLLLMAAPWHLFMLRSAYTPGGEHSPLMLPVVVFAAAVGLVVGAMAVLVPLRAGVRALQKMEF
jgi:ABC-2 type transport system permease protein